MHVIKVHVRINPQYPMLVIKGDKISTFPLMLLQVEHDKDPSPLRNICIGLAEALFFCTYLLHCGN